MIRRQGSEKKPIRELDMIEPCAFCDIAKGKRSACVVYEDAATMAFLDIHPISEGHTLVIPKKHFANIDTMPDQLLRKFFASVRTVSTKIKKSLQPDGLHIGINDGIAANQIVPHVHVHLIPRKFNDGVTFLKRMNPTGSELESVRKLVLVGR